MCAALRIPYSEERLLSGDYAYLVWLQATAEETAALIKESGG